MRWTVPVPMPSAQGAEAACEGHGYLEVAKAVADYGQEQERGVACFMDDFEACITHLRSPVTHRRAIRTTNLLERLFSRSTAALISSPTPLAREPF